VTETTGEGIIRRPGEGETTALFGDTYVVKAAGEETGGALAVIEAALAPRSGGTPLHVNTLEDAGGNVRPHSQGHRPYPLERHRAPVRLLGFPAPAGFELFFADLAELLAGMPPGPPDMGRMAAVYEKYGLRVVGPPPSSEH
jgi:hypothetical protein